MFRFFGKLVLWLFAIVGVVVVIAIGAAAVFVTQFRPEKEPLPAGMILTVDLDRALDEGPGVPWLPGDDPRGLPMRTLLDGLQRAATDDRVKGLVARVRAPQMGMAQAQEVRDAIHAFHANGKPTYVFADTMPADGGSGTLAYYLASAFDQVWLQPSGEVGLIGLAIELPFLARTLDRWGLSFDVSAREEYKGAAANLTDAAIPPALEENLGRLVASWFDQMQAGISAARGVPLEDLGRAIDRAPLLADEAVAAGLVDRTGYADEFRGAVEEAVGELPRLSVEAYLARRDDPKPDAARRIALVHGVGPVVLGGGEDTPDFGLASQLRADDVADAIRAAVDDERVAAIVLRLDTPGGSYVAADTVRRAVAQAQARGTPVIVSMGNTAASGGYFIALQADQILASPGTVTASIGVVAGKPVIRDLSEDLEITWARLSEGRNAAMWSPTEPFSLAAQQALDKRLDAIYADFTGRVGTARGLSAAQLDRAARGRVFTGADALDVGLVDRLGGLREALQAAREAAALPADEAVVVAPYPAPLDPIERLFRLLEGRGVPGIAEQMGGLTQAELRTLVRLIGLVDPALAHLDPLVGGDGGRAQLRYDGPTHPADVDAAPMR